MTKALRSQPTRDRILGAARKLFGRDGYDRTTIRSIATAASINPALVLRYYGSKEGLFSAATDFDLQLPDLRAVPRAELGRTLMLHLIRRWDTSGDDLPALLRAAVTHEHGQERMLHVFRVQVVQAFSSVCAPDQLTESAALVATQLIGLAFSRYVVRLEPVVALPDDVLIAQVGRTLQWYLTGETT